MPIDQKAIVESFLPIVEACREKAYRDSGGIWTIGVGHTGPDVHVGEVITTAQERALLDHDLTGVYSDLYLLNERTPIMATQFLGFASFAYNCGRGALKDVLAGTAKIEHFIHDHLGKVLGGLVTRRRFELACLGMDVTVLDDPKPIPPKG